MRAVRRDERGATLVIVAVLLVALVGAAAIVVDVGAMYQERRTLRNGADAAALAIAKMCSTGTRCAVQADVQATAEEYAAGNADDQAATVDHVCLFGPAFPAAYFTDTASPVSGPASPSADPWCSQVPSALLNTDGSLNGANGVRVHVKTKTSDGSDKVAFGLGKLFGRDGATVGAPATVVWGGPSPTSGFAGDLPFALGECEYDHFTETNGMAPPPPYTASHPYPSAPFTEVVIEPHTTTSPYTDCGVSASGAVLPGGYGWLTPVSGTCDAPAPTNGWLDALTGAPMPSTCRSGDFSNLIGYNSTSPWPWNVIRIPIFDCIAPGATAPPTTCTGDPTGTHSWFHIKFYAAFYMTGYLLPGMKKKSIVTNQYPCDPSRGDTCISGFFVDDPTPVHTTVGGADMGVTVIQMIP